MFKKFLIFISSAALGLVAGWYGGYSYYQMTTPSGQFGYEFDGMDQAAIGAIIGLVIFTFASYFIFIKNRK
jgi:hypothetical protein